MQKPRLQSYKTTGVPNRQGVYMSHPKSHPKSRHIMPQEADLEALLTASEDADEPDRPAMVLAVVVVTLATIAATLLLIGAYEHGQEIVTTIWGRLS